MKVSGNGDLNRRIPFNEILNFLISEMFAINDVKLCSIWRCMCHQHHILLVFEFLCRSLSPLTKFRIRNGESVSFTADQYCILELDHALVQIDKILEQA